MKTRKPEEPADPAKQNEAMLFEMPEDEAQEMRRRLDERVALQQQQGEARILVPNREQVELRPTDLESLLSADHRARLVWDYVEQQDLSELLGAIKARGSNAGRSVIDPRILFALWLYATLDGVGSGREVARLCQEHDAYRWICGGVQVNYHTLNDFRSANESLMDGILSQNVAALAASGVITLERVAQDGMRVRAAAGAASFRRQTSLEQHLKEAEELVRTLKDQVASDPAVNSRKEQAARLRAAEQRQERVRSALKELPKVIETKKRQGKKAEEARVSTTDPDARVMKMGDGGFRPAVNVQLATTCEEQIIVGMDVVNAGSDMSQLQPMVEQVQERLGESPKQWLVDGGYPAHDQLDAVADKTTVYAPVPQLRVQKDEQGQEIKQDKYAPKAGDSQAARQWRDRMAGEQAAEIYKLRASTAECANAQARNRGLLRMPVRGLEKMKSVVGLFVLAHNLLRMAKIAPFMLGRGTNPIAAALNNS